MSRPTLSAQPRDIRGKAVARLRKGGTLPAVVYGAGMPSQNISLDTHEFELLRRRTGRHAVIDLSIDGDGKVQPVLLQAIQEHPVNRRTLHVDLLVVDLSEERTVDVPLIFVGQSEAVAKQGGVMLHMRDSVLVRSKPDDLPSGIELDITPLTDFEAVLHASDLVMPAGVTMVTDASEPIARVQQPRIEEEAVVGAAEAAAAEAAAETTEKPEGGAAEASDKAE
ncbi:MAG: 50S ribosomal protein L25 [Chloroflexota bacterium]|nr:50S ribosomal protein L25 [Chloroflexota bacterium]